MFYDLVSNELIMLETRLGEFEEVILLLVGILGEEAYALRVAKEFENQTKRKISIGAAHSALKRLSEKGFLKSEMGAPSSKRGGRRTRIYTITAIGQQALEEAKSLRQSLWNQFPAWNKKILGIA